MEMPLKEFIQLPTVSLECTPENQRMRLSERIKTYVNDNLPGLKNTYLAEQSLMLDNSQLTSLLNKSVEKAIGELKEFEDWVTVRLKDIDYIVDQLADMAIFLIEEQQDFLSEERGLGKSDSEWIEINWRSFFDVISGDLIKYQRAFLLSAYIDWLKNQQSTKDEIFDNSANEKKVTYAQRALFYIYLHTTNSLPDFSQHPKGKLAAINEIATAIPVSSKYFEQTHNQLLKYTNRTNRNQIRNIKVVITMLEGYPLAQERLLLSQATKPLISLMGLFLLLYLMPFKATAWEGILEGRRWQG